MNLLEETIEDIHLGGHKPKDIVFIGSESGFSCTWEEYKKLADCYYDSGYGAQKVASDLIIVFSDGSTMWRHEYDGSEAWHYSYPFKIPKETKKIKSLFVPSDCVGWMDLAEINAE